MTFAGRPALTVPRGRAGRTAAASRFFRPGPRFGKRLTPSLPRLRRRDRARGIFPFPTHLSAGAGAPSEHTNCRCAAWVGHCTAKSDAKSAQAPHAIRRLSRQHQHMRPFGLHLSVAYAAPHGWARLLPADWPPGLQRLRRSFLWLVQLRDRWAATRKSLLCSRLRSCAVAWCNEAWSGTCQTLRKVTTRIRKFCARLIASPLK